MKKRYIFIITVLILGFIIFCYLIFYKPFGEHPRLGNLIQGSGIFVALLAAVIALSVADPRKKYIKTKIELSISKPSVHLKSNLPAELRNAYKEFPNSFKSYRVEFKMLNNSGFTLKKPTLTFKLPVQKQHPFQVGKNWIRTFNSNLFNSQNEMRLLDFADTRILSNSNLPYWNNKDEIVIWIRMCSSTTGAFVVEVSINSENAEGTTEKVKVNLQNLIAGLET